MVWQSMIRIKCKYIGSWLIDQLSQPDWFGRLIVHRRSWGAYSQYAHLKRSDGMPKIGYSTRKKAQKAADDMKKKYGSEFLVYKCLYCDGWHVSKDTHASTVQSESIEALALKPYSIKKHERSHNLDIDLILSTNIPDLAQVYGGFRGRTLSSQRQLPVWKKMVKGGILHIIDLRADYTSNFYRDLCTQSGIDYFHYPVAYDEKSTVNMAKRFPELCSLIDDGRFYIACAQGLHRTDIALCIYWVFHGADIGIEPPKLKGYLKEKGMSTSKIMRVLNALYKYWTEQVGTSPIKDKTFIERKKIINELSLRKEEI